MTMKAAENYGKFLLSCGNVVEAEAIVVENVEARKRVHGADHPDTRSAMSVLAMLKLSQARCT